MNFLCRLGLHTPRWQPAYRTSRDHWLRIRTCRRCGTKLPRLHR